MKNPTRNSPVISSEKPGEQTDLESSIPRWRVGSKVPLNVYEGDRPACQCHNAEDAARIVDAMNVRRDAEASKCLIPPDGWLCTREPGHEGPCAAYPIANPFSGSQATPAHLPDGKGASDK